MPPLLSLDACVSSWTSAVRAGVFFVIGSLDASAVINACFALSMSVEMPLLGGLAAGPDETAGSPWAWMSGSVRKSALGIRRDCRDNGRAIT